MVNESVKATVMPDIGVDSTYPPLIDL